MIQSDEAVLAGWRMLLDDGPSGRRTVSRRTARPMTVRTSKTTAKRIGAADGDNLTITTGRGSVQAPLEITVMADDVVWLPLNSNGNSVHERLGVTNGAVVKIKPVAGRSGATR